VCGTNAFKPLCRVLKRKPERFNEIDPYETVLEFSGTGLSPLDPKHNSTFYREDDFLYAATGKKKLEKKIEFLCKKFPIFE
jgi:hypothetical protein